MAGLSAGGAATIDTVFSRPDLFRYVVIMSAGGPANLQEAYPKFFGNNGAGAKGMKLIWVAVGDEDFALKGSRGISETLTTAGIEHQFVLNPGYRHEWRLWRQHLWDFAPLLFRQACDTS